MQIAKGYNHELISEVALRCNDTEYRDFIQQIYGQTSYREERELAREYSILERLFVIKVEKDGEDIYLPLINYKAEYQVLINDKKFTKVNDITDASDYVLKFFDGKLILDYHNKIKGDVVKIFYTTLGETGEEYDGTILVPNKYYEELLRRVCIGMAKLGIAKFINEKKAKYQTVYQLYSKIGKDPNLAVDSQWIAIKPYQYL